jgi:7-cyano-7-deazaguanine synthase in queuosine biosynthesis
VLDGTKGNKFLVLLMRDLLPRVQGDELCNSFAVTARAVLGIVSQLSRLKDSDKARLPYTLWAQIREKFPDAASFPLGTVSERAVKRFIIAFLQLDPDVKTGFRLESQIKKRSPAAVMAGYTTTWLFEAAMFNLRGNSEDLENDFGFWYHWNPGGGLRSLKNEANMRHRLYSQCQEYTSRLMKIWFTSKNAKIGFPGPHEIIHTFCEVFGVSIKPPAKWVESGGQRPLTVLGLKPKIDVENTTEAIATNHKLITLKGKNANSEIRDKEMIKVCGGDPHSLVRDLIEIATIVYVSDIHLQRGELLERDLVYLIPVRHPDIWNESAQLLSRTVSFLSFNTAEFRFVQSDAKKSRMKTFKVKTDSGKCVALFSGGLDSFVGATELLGDTDGPRPILLSHCPSPMLTYIQKELTTDLRKRHEDLVHVQVHAGPVTSRSLPKLYRLGPAPPQVLYQYNRSFLFLSLAACIALENGIAEIYIHENGAVALNPSFSEAKFNTRTTHPVFIRHFSEMIKAVFGVELKFITPYVLKTKGEVVGLLDEVWHKSIRHTNSCWAYSNVRVWAKHFGVDKDFNGSHCGRCIPCIWRRASLKSAGLSHKDDSYLWDKIPGEKWGRWLNRVHFTQLMDQLRFCENALTRPPRALLDLCPDFYDGEYQVAEKIGMYKRFSKDILNWFADHSDKIQYSLPGS